uniref:DUF2793 domain-containing protein n=1 Tax=Rhodopseudomonas palustris (strain BisA53) TaxID=316055 RepID=Q07QB5_RHOP5
MTDTANLGLPLIDAGQAQKHVTHNEALRILDAAIQIAVEDRNRTVPPPSPAEGQRHVVAAAATGAWAGHGEAIAMFQGGAWDFLTPRAGWCLWSIADDAMCVFDGTQWRDIRSLALDNLSRLGVNTAAAAPNLFAAKSNAALFAAIDVADGGSGDARVQISKQSAANTASVVFSDNYSGRAEFGLVGSDAFRLKVSGDGASFVDALVIDQSSGNAALPRGLALTGVVAPAQLTASQNDFAPPGLAAAAVLQLSADAARSISGLAGGAEGRVVVLINVGSQPITLLDNSGASAAANRFAVGGPLAIAGQQAAILRYDGAAARWRAIAGGAGASPARAGMTNRIINPEGAILQRGAGPVADDAYGFDRWYVLCETATVAIDQLLDQEAGTPWMMRHTQAQPAAQRIGTAQIIEAANCKDLRGAAVMLSARVRMSSSATLRYAIVEWTGAADTLTSDVVNNWNSGTFAPGHFFAAAATTVAAVGSAALAANVLTNVSLPATISAAARNLIVMFWTEAAAAQNATMDIGRVQLEAGGAATPFARRSLGDELNLCIRYYRTAGRGAPAFAANPTMVFFSATIFPPMRAAPSYVALKTAVVFRDPVSGSQTSTASTHSVSPGAGGIYVELNGYSGLTAGRQGVIASDDVCGLVAEL